MKVEIKELIGQNCLTLEEGEKVYQQILPELNAGHEVVLEFDGVGVFASPFFNSAIGRLLKDKDSDELNRLLHFEHLASAGWQVLRRVVENAKQYYTEPDLRKALEEILHEQGEER